MLELKNVTKIYHLKKAEDVVALDDISLKFPEKGMVFILGKSGSGKSTFLNVVGGLDSFDRGEIIINGRSSRGFSQSDFDSYRNTYIGFIFQEYNILEELSVKKNIALALELQGKDAGEEEIKRILSLVDLDGLEDRKPKELSGGQKQRVAIARAIVKNPEIIMADEPTGALDSQTGKQVLTTLKNLSKGKLVIVVSHDREFAETYADRIVEFKDGKILSDVTSGTGRKEKSGFECREKEWIRIRKNHRLSQEEKEEIIRCIEENEGDTFIALDPEISGKIDAKGVKIGAGSRFEPTDESRIEEREREFTAIRSKLSFRNSFIFGLNSMKVKPFRLILVILLSCISFGLFGFVDTLSSYSATNTIVNSIVSTNIDYASFTKNYTSYRWITNLNSEKTVMTGFSGTQDIAYLNDCFNLDFKGVYKNTEVGDFSLTNNMLRDYSEANSYYVNELSGLIEADEETLKSLNYHLAYGRLPENPDEICLTDYTYSLFREQGYYNHFNTSDRLLISEMTPYEEYMDENTLVVNAMTGENRTLFVNNQEFKIVGILHTGFDFDKYEILIDNIDDSSYRYLNENYQLNIRYGYHNLGYLAPGSLSTIIEENQLSLLNALTTYRIETANVRNAFSFSYIGKRDQIPEGTVLKDGLSELSDQEAIVSDSFLFDRGGLLTKMQAISLTEEDRNFYGVSDLAEAYSLIKEKKIEEYAASHPEEAAAYNPYGGTERYIQFLSDTGTGYYVNPYGTSGYELVSEEKNRLLNAYRDAIFQVSFQVAVSDANAYLEEARTYRMDVVGFYVANNDVSGNCLIVSDGNYARYVGVEESYYAFVVAKMPKSRNTIRRLVNFEDSEADVYYCMNNESKIAIDVLNATLEASRDICFLIGLALSVFSVLFLFNFISVSISNKKHEIGILRAIGSRSTDVLKIFFTESFIIAMINFLLSSVLLSVVSAVGNFIMQRFTGLSVALFSPGVRQFGIMFLISCLVAYISCAIPVYSVAKKKPINVIKG